MSDIATWFSSLRKMINDPLYVSSFYMIFCRVVIIASGFVFWIIAAQFYKVEDIGHVTTLLSVSSSIILLAPLGFDYSLIRFYTQEDGKNIFNTSFIIVTMTTVALSIGYILFAGIITPGMTLLQNPVYALMFIVYNLALAWSSIVSRIFQVLRQTVHYFFQNIILLARIPFLIPLSAIGAFGIFGAEIAAYYVSFIFIIYVLRKAVKIDFSFDRVFIRQSLEYSIKIYVSTVLSSLNSLLLPIIVYNLLGSVESAKYYMAASIGWFFIQVPAIIGISLLVEGTHGENLRDNVYKALLAIYAILVPGFIVILFFGGMLLGLFGEVYIGATGLLILIGLSSFFFAIFSVYTTMENVRMKINRILILNALLTVIMVTLSVYFIERYGSIGAGFSMIVSYFIMDVIVVLLVLRERWFKILRTCK